MAKQKYVVSVVESDGAVVMVEDGMRGGGKPGTDGAPGTDGTDGVDCTGVMVTELLTLGLVDVDNKYIDLADTPLHKASTFVFPVGGIKQNYGTDFTIVTDGTSIKRLHWNGLGLESVVAEDDVLSIGYTHA